MGSVASVFAAIATSCAGGEATTAATATATASASASSTSDSLTRGSTSVASSSTSEGSATETAAATTASDGCQSDRECPPGFACVDGQCEFDGGPCSGATWRQEIARVALLLVIDKSGSMVDSSWDHDGDPDTPSITRWRSVAAAIEGFAATHEATLELGLVLFPGLDATSEPTLAACPVAASPAVAVGPMHAAMILDALPDADAGPETIAGATPGRAALEVAASHLAAEGEGLARAIVLVTDGAANCDPDAVDDLSRFETYDPGIVDAAAAALSDGIRTFVVGVDVAKGASPGIVDGEPDGVDLHEVLDAVAIAGGAALDDPAAKFLDAHDEAAILGSLEAIAAELLPCAFVTIEPLAPPCSVEVRIGESVYPGPAESCDGVDGWRYTAGGYAHLELCGQACAEYRALGAADVDYDFCC
ncbi:MAG: hypothetical protein R3B09_22700 [Nannocystaceae bacterium]